MKSELRQIALDNLNALNGNPKPGWSPDIFSSDLGDRMLELGIDMDCGEAFREFYGGLAFEDADEYRRVAAVKGDDLNALATGVFSQWRYYSHWSYCPPSERMYEWFRVLLQRLVDMTEEDRGIR